MMTMTTVHSTANLPERQRRALALLASAACPSTEWPRAFLLIGMTSVEAALVPDRQVAVFWVGQGGAEGLIGWPALLGYLRDGVPIVALCRSYADASAIAAALQRECAA